MIEKIIKYQGEILHLLNDESVFYLLGKQNNSLYFTCFDDNFNIILNKNIGLDINLEIQPLITDSYIYVYDTENSIYVLDKFSGTLASVINLGMMTSIQGQYQDENYLYTVCKVPISDVEKRRNAFEFNISKINKFQNKKELQSCSFSTPLSNLYVYNNLLYIQTKENVYVFNKDLKKINTIPLNWQKNCFVFETCVISENGILLDFKEPKRYFIHPNILHIKQKEQLLKVITKDKEINYDLTEKKEVCSKELFIEKVLYNNDDFYIFNKKNSSILIHNNQEFNHQYVILKAAKRNNIVMTFDESRSLIKWHF